jgi:hypothetical protein
MKKLIIILLALFLVSGCRSKKAAVVKKEESVSVLQQNDIRTSETEKIQTEVLKINDLKNLSLSPEDPDKELQVIFRGDTLKAKNANINFSHTKSSETDNSTVDRHKDKSDKSSTAFETDSSSKEKNVDVQSASWGTNIGFILAAVVGVILLFLYFKTRSPP